MKVIKVAVLLMWVSGSVLAYEADLTQSTIGDLANVTVQACMRLVEDAKKLNKPVLEVMITDKTISEYYWGPYGKYLFKMDKITAHDLMWLMREHDNPKQIKKEQAKLLFKTLIIDNLAPQAQGAKHKQVKPTVKSSKTERIFGLLTKVSIPEDYSVDPSWHKSYGAAFTNAIFSPLAKAIEEDLKESINEITTHWPQEKLFLDIKACEREERNDKATRGYFEYHKYDKKLYNLASWFLRKDNYDSSIYLDKSSGYSKPYYIALVQWRLKLTKDSKKVGKVLFSLATILDKNSQLPEGVTFESLVKKRENPNDLLAKNFTAKQLEILKAKFPNHFN